MRINVVVPDRGNPKIKNFFSGKMSWISATCSGVMGEISGGKGSKELSPKILRASRRRKAFNQFSFCIC
jgi:ribosomal protein L2